MALATLISAFNRKRKWNAFLEMVAPDSKCKILDVGFSENEYSPVDNYLEKHYKHLENVTALGIDIPDKFQTRYPDVRAVRYGGRHFPFEDDSFDICWSNAVIEHVGGYESQLFFLKEITRVAGIAFITTPNRYFPVEVHSRLPLLHYLPKKIFDKILCLIGKRWCSGGYLNLLGFRAIKKLLKDARINNFRIIRNKLFFFTLDFIILIERCDLRTKKDIAAHRDL